MAQRTTVPLLWYLLVPGESTKTLTLASPSAGVLCPVDVGPSKLSVGRRLYLCN